MDHTRRTAKPTHDATASSPFASALQNAVVLGDPWVAGCEDSGRQVAEHHNVRSVTELVEAVVYRAELAIP